MTPYSAGDVVLVRFPFTDLTSTKKRPALVLSPPEYYARECDAVLLALTSQRQPEETLALKHWQPAGLLKPTWCKPLLATVALSTVAGRLGTLQEDDYTGVFAAPLPLTCTPIPQPGTISMGSAPRARLR